MTKIQLKRSNVLEGGKAKEPTSGQTEYGELCVNYNESDPALFIRDSADNIVRLAGVDSVSSPAVGDGTITIRQPGTADQTFTVNQDGDTEINLLNDNTVVTPGDGTITIVQPGISNQTFTTNQAGNTTITLKNDNTVVTPGDGSLTIETAGEGASATGSFNANQAGDSTITLPAIRYADLSGKPTIPAAAGNGTITITQPGTSDQTFTVNQSGNTTIALRNDNSQYSVGNGALEIKTAGEGAVATGSFTANQDTKGTINLPTIRYQDLSGKPTIPSEPGNGTITIVQPGTSNQTFTVNQSGNKTITLKNDNTVVTPGNGALTIRNFGDTTNSTGTFTANQGGNSTVTLPQIKYANISGTPTIPSVPTVGNGALTIKTYGQNANSTGTYTANQSGASSLTLPQIRYQDISGTPTIPSVPTVGNGALTIKTAGQGASATGTFTANQSGASTLTLPTIRYQDISGAPTITGQYLSRTGPDTGVGPLTSSNGWVVGSGYGSTTWDASGSVISWKGDAAGQIYRFSADDTTKANAGLSSDYSHIVQIASSVGSNALSAARHNPNTGGNQSYSKVAVFANRAANVNLTGGNSNSNNTPGCIATQFKFTNQTSANQFNFYNVQSCLSTAPGTTSAINELNLYYSPASCIGLNDGTTDRSLQNTKIRAFHSGLMNDGSQAGSTQTWAFYGSGNAPSYFGGLVRASQGIDFSNDKDAVAADANETLERYEKGTYTPVLNNSGGATYSSRSGSYIIIGNRCEVLVDMTYSGASGTSQISVSLPFASSALTGSLSGFSGSVYILNAPSALTMPIAATVGNSQTQTLLVKSGVRTQNYSQSTVKYNDATNGQLRVQISYTI